MDKEMTELTWKDWFTLIWGALTTVLIYMHTLTRDRQKKVDDKLERLEAEKVDMASYNATINSLRGEISHMRDENISGLESIRSEVRDGRKDLVTQIGALTTALLSNALKNGTK